MVLVEAYADNVVPVVRSVAAPALLGRRIPLSCEGLVYHLEMPQQVTGRGLVAFGADPRPWRGMPEARDLPGLDAMARNATLTKEGLMAIDVTGCTSNLGVQDSMFHA